jgi:hypothetical protein
MLTQQSEKELQQLDEQIRFERDTLEGRLNDDRREWPRTWKKMQKTRNKQFRQQLIINKTPFEEEKILMRKVKSIISFIIILRRQFFPLLFFISLIDIEYFN